MNATERLSEELDAAIQKGLSEESIKNFEKQLRESVQSVVFDDLEWTLKDELAGNLARFVHCMADEAVEQLLLGNADEMRARLKCSENHWTGRDRKHSVIHGRLLESDPIALRREIAQAHRDLIESERIADLEAQVASLVEQITELELEKDQLQERLARVAR